MAEAVLANPFIGPRAFTEKNSGLFFGRTEETRELASLVIARRAVLLYAQSGSGKTSLLQASLIPELKRRKRVATFPMARVTGSADASGGLYVENALASLFPDAPAGSLQGKSFAEAFGTALAAETQGDAQTRRQARLVIFDQFEEIFTYHPELIGRRQEFFQQLGECLAAHAELSLLLSMREDYLADLEAYAPLLPDRMRTRMRLERLGVESAVEAIRQPAALAGLPFAAGAAEQLVDNLRRIRTGSAGTGGPGSGGFALGLHVEPVQLQIVCQQLWSRVTADPAGRKPEIDADDIAKYANVDDALIRFYRDSLAKAQRAGVTERALRRWFGERLITPAGTRGLVYRGEQETEGLANEAVDTLRDCYIIRADVRGGNIWYELAHDRLVEPVRQDNMAWRVAYRNPVADALARNPDNPISGSALRDALQFAKANPHELTLEEKQFLRKSDEAEKQTRARRKRFIFGGAAMMIVLLILTSWALWEAGHAEQQARVATSGRLATAALLIQDRRPDLAALLSLEAKRAFDGFEARNAQLSTLQANPGLIAILNQRNDSVYTVAFSPDGKLLASAGSDGLIWLWDVPSHALIGEPWAGHTDAVTGLAFSRDGKTLVSGSYDKTVRIWDVASRKPLGEPLKCDVVNGIALSPDGKKLAAAGEDDKVWLWDLSSGSPAGRQLAGHTAAVNSVAFSPDSTMLASAGDDSTVRLWDVEARRQTATMTGHSGNVLSVAFSPDGTTVASGGQDKTVRLWEVRTQKQLGAALQGQSGDIWSVAFSPDGAMLASASADQTLRLWDMRSRLPIGEPLTGHSAPINGVAFSPDGKMLASASDDQTARLWAVTRRQQLANAMDGQSGAIESLAFSPDGKTLASAGEDQTIRLWDVAGRSPLGEPLQGHSGKVWSIAFSPNGKALAAGSADGTVRLWDVAGRKHMGDPLTRQPDQDDVFSVAFSPDGKTLATGSFDPNVRLWDVASRQPLGDPLHGRGQSIRSVAFSPSGRMLASAGVGDAVRLWSLPSRQPLRELGLNSIVFAVAFNADGTLLATGGYDRMVRLWDAASGKPVGDPLPGHSAQINSVAFSPDGKTLASASDDGTVRLWDVTSRQPLGDPLPHASEVKSVAFSPGGKLLASGNTVGRVWLWDIDPNSWSARLCRVAGRNLKMDEWQHFVGPDVAYRRTCPDLPPGEGAPPL